MNADEMPSIALERRLAGSHFVLLGETHDNAEHHRVQRLDEEIPRDEWPPTRVVHWAFDLMVASGLANGLIG